MSAALEVCQQRLQLLLVGAGKLVVNFFSFGKDECWHWFGVLTNE